MIPISGNKGWLLIISIGLSLVAIGALLDFFLKKNEVKNLHKLFIRFANAIAKTPLREWQMIIAREGLKFISILHPVMSIMLDKSLGFFVGMLNVKGKGKMSLFSLLLCYIVLFFSVPVLYSNYNLWMLGILSFPFTILGLWVLAQLISELVNALWDFALKKMPYPFKSIMPYPFKSIWPYDSNLKTLLTISGVSWPVTIAFLSSAASLSALIISVYFIPTSLLNSSWFIVEAGTLKPTSALLFTLVNFPFDLITVLFTTMLLNMLIKLRRYIVLIAAIDIIASGVLTILLYVMLQLIDNDWDILSIPTYFMIAVQRLPELIVLTFSLIGGKMLSAPVVDLHLLPLLLTTFLPVSLYFTIFIFLSFAKPVLWLAQRFFESVGERDESVFKQLGVLVSVIMAALKAIYDYLSVTP